MSQRKLFFTIFAEIHVVVVVKHKLKDTGYSKSDSRQLTNGWEHGAFK